MNSLRIHLEADRRNYAPGETIQGYAEWNIIEGNPGDAHVHLLWHTEGKGTKDVDIVQSNISTGGGASGKCDFEWKAPEAPYSYSGTLLSIVWEVELVVDGISDVERVEIQIHPKHKEREEREIESKPGWVPSGF